MLLEVGVDHRPCIFRLDVSLKINKEAAIVESLRIEWLLLLLHHE
jgi:hypothetical protein